jgi:hypothetical protein
MKEYTKEFDGVTCTFTESDLYEPASYVLKRFRDDMVDAKKRMGSRYTEEVDNKVQSLIDDFIVSSFKNQVDIMNYTLDWSKDVTPENAFRKAKSIGQYADRYIKVAEGLINSVAEELRLMGVPVCKQII